MTNILNEETFESNIVSSLTTKGGYVEGNPKDFDAQIALDLKTLFQFIKTSQSEKWEKLKEVHKGENVEEKVLQRLQKELDLHGMLHCLRHGITDYGVKIDLAYYKPDSKLNPETIELYEKNILKVTRQVHFSTKNPNLSIDLLLSLNGLPIATAELKNQFTGQDVKNAKSQFKFDRSDSEMLFKFKKRALVHFALDSDAVEMTTQLKGKETVFLPFNKGDGNGAGNSINPDGYKTAYLWEDIWSKDNWLDIFRRFVHLSKKEFKVDGKTKTKETLIFPRYHQLDVVKKITKDVKEKGTGKNYLIQHSAGSGKSNSIAWLAYRLSSLHNKEDLNIFDSVVVVTDRVVLDQQLQDTIYQFEHKQGVVQKIDKNSAQLKEALETGVKIIITTVQKFPFILDEISDLSDRRFAVIVDEAHSSQGGETGKKLKEALAGYGERDIEEKESNYQEDYEDRIRKSMKARGKQDNLSFFAFTATPKAKTLEVFGEDGPDSKPRPFHLYSMRQAIEEEFILDVLKSYTTYKTYFKLSKNVQDDPEMDRKKASRAIARFLSLHPHNLAQKTEVMIEHFRQKTMKKIGGKAKAMVVTSSRMHAYRYYIEFNKYLREKNYTNIKALVAFSGVLKDPETGEPVIESDLNNIREKELPEKFATDDYRILLVADKYQTGFDQPLLHTMFVDKKLSGVQAVQTLSRLNRTCSGKEDTFVLDFVNSEDEILEAFQPYYEMTLLSERTDPNHLYDLKNKIEEKQIFWKSEVESIAKIYFDHKIKKVNQAKLYAILEPALDRYKKNLKEDEQEDYKTALTAFVRIYSFLSQIVPFDDTYLEKFYLFVRLLRNRLPKRESEKFELNNEVALQYYRLQKISESNIELDKEGKVDLESSITEAGIKREKDEEDKARLTEIIQIMNDKHGTDFTGADRLFVDQVEADIMSNSKLIKQAKNNSKENFKYPFSEELLDMLIQRMERNEDFAMRFINDTKLRTKLEDYLTTKIYNKLKKEDISKLIQKGESQNLEFKSSLRWDVKKNEVNKDLEKVILKTIAGFMNSTGGQLVIGVDDDGDVIGLENDYKTLGDADRDKFELHLTQLVKNIIGVEKVQYVRISFDDIKDHDVCLVTIFQSKSPIFIKYKNEEKFFVRTGNNTSPFSLSESQKYIKDHWK